MRSTGGNSLRADVRFTVTYCPLWFLCCCCGCSLHERTAAVALAWLWLLLFFFSLAIATSCYQLYPYRDHVQHEQ